MYVNIIMFSLQSSSFKVFKLIAVAATLLAFTAPTLTKGNPITKRQFQKIAKLLEESMASEIPSEDDTKYSDILYQEKYDQKNLTYYHAGDKKFPVFISNGFGSIDRPIHILVRGEDYLNPKDRNNFVVLKKSSTDPKAYTVHRAHILDVLKTLTKGGKVIWNDVHVEQQKDMKPLLEQMGNSEVQARSTRSQRPLCDWIGFSLLCNTPKNIPPARERTERQPLDEEDDEPVKLHGVVSEESDTTQQDKKSKRFIGLGTWVKSEEGEHSHSMEDFGIKGIKSVSGINVVPPKTSESPTPTGTIYQPEDERLGIVRNADGELVANRRIRRRHRRRRTTTESYSIAF